MLGWRTLACNQLLLSFALAWYPRYGAGSIADAIAPLEACSGSFPGVCSVQSLRAGGGKILGSRPRIAVLVVGLKDRFYPETTLRHVVAPAVKDGYDVDYYVLLALHTSREKWHSTWLFPSPNPAFRNLTSVALQEYIAKRAGLHNASNVIVYLLRRDVTTSEVPFDLSWRRWLGRSSRIDKGLLLSLSRLKKIELLWNRTSSAGVRYEHTILVRDDAYWVDDLHMSHFQDSHAIYARPRGRMCAASETPWMPHDGVFVVGGQVAGLFLRVYSEYLLNPSPELDTVKVEGFFRMLAKLKGIQFHIVRHSWLPFLLANHMWLPEWKRPVFCLRELNRSDLAEPTTDCVHPSRVRRRLCSAWRLSP